MTKNDLTETAVVDLGPVRHTGFGLVDRNHLPFVIYVPRPENAMRNPLLLPLEGTDRLSDKRLDVPELRVYATVDQKLTCWDTQSDRESLEPGDKVCGKLTESNILAPLILPDRLLFVVTEKRDGSSHSDETADSVGSFGWIRTLVDIIADKRKLCGRIISREGIEKLVKLLNAAVDIANYESRFAHVSFPPLFITGETIFTVGTKKKAGAPTKDAPAFEGREVRFLP